jgi:hypothetical protein
MPCAKPKAISYTVGEGFVEVGERGCMFLRIIYAPKKVKNPEKSASQRYIFFQDRRELFK